MNKARLLFLCISMICACISHAQIRLGVDCFFDEGHDVSLKGKRVGLVTNHTGVNGKLVLTSDLFLEKDRPFTLSALFSPEHGLSGSSYAFEKVKHGKLKGVPVYSLHGETRRPNDKMLKGIHTLVYDIQGIGTRPYTYATTLFYIMEEAAKRKIEVIVLDRPNPMGGMVVDGPMLEAEWRSFIGYVNVPYCHGMTIGELAHLFNEEYNLKCKLKVIPMKGWSRKMDFKDTGLKWIPPSPHIPESDTPFFCASTGMLGEIELVNIGVGYTLPFKVVGASWIDADEFASALNKQKLPGVHFTPFHYKPFYGSYKGVDCHGVLIVIDNPMAYRPMKVQFALLGILKSLYPKKFKKSFSAMSESKKKLFCKASGGCSVWNILETERFATWKLIEVDKIARESFLIKREKYLRPEYSKH
ncbi:MAG: hypothetical protein S4CHLAM37_13420 [Chlamydiia bacterium]|nr:hypothetical protein [Chlamydiia bacterium]